MIFVIIVQVIHKIVPLCGWPVKREREGDTWNLAIGISLAIMCMRVINITGFITVTVLYPVFCFPCSNNNLKTRFLFRF